MDALTAVSTSCGFGRAVATPVSYAFLATAQATLADMSLISLKPGRICPLARCSANQRRIFRLSDGAQYTLHHEVL